LAAARSTRDGLIEAIRKKEVTLDFEKNSQKK
jgi:hypothetical protein